MTASRAVHKAVTFLKSAQQEDGSFQSLSSPLLQDFSNALQYPSIFPTALILNCMRSVPAATQIRRHAAGFLLWHRSEQWTWNYWRRDSLEAREQPYPDDLDDTACVLAALTNEKNEVIDGTVLGYFAQQLIANEIAPGGPYKTWMVRGEHVIGWDDVDVAVNANIGYCLYLQDVKLPGLETYITQSIESNALQSAYYVDTVPTLYFIARWYYGSARTALQQIVAQKIQDPTQYPHALMQALLLTAACHLEIPLPHLKACAERLLALQVEDRWPAEGLYRDPSIKDIPYYAGSEALTTAFVVEALTAYERLQPHSELLPKRLPYQPSKMIAQALVESENIGQPELRRLYGAQLKRFTPRAARQITAIADMTAAACGRPLPARTAQALNLGSLHGWLAYTIYDDFLDDEGNAELLGTANLSLRRTVQHFRAALPDNPIFGAFVEEWLDIVDGANTWEATQARAVAKRGRLHIRRLPDYGDYSQLAQRSWGHVLAPAGVLLALGYKPKGLEIQHLKQFFHHYLIARQLNDDAHDWEDDLKHGRFTAVITMLLASFPVPMRLDLQNEFVNLQHTFWEETILKVARLIRKHVRAARAELRQCSFLQDASEYQQWLTELERATTEALKGRLEARKFMNAYVSHESTG